MMVENVVDLSAPAEFVQLYRDEFAAMVRLARLIVRSPELAEELVHDAFVSVYGRFDQLDRPGAYLRQVVVNNCRGSLRRSSVGQRKLLDVSATSRPDDDITLPPEYDETWQALRLLNETQRTALVLRFYLDLPIGEIAETMGIPTGTVKSVIHRGIASLRKELES